VRSARIELDLTGPQQAKTFDQGSKGYLPTTTIPPGGSVYIYTYDPVDMQLTVE
jgi:hypothetical protein